MPREMIELPEGVARGDAIFALAAAQVDLVRVSLKSIEQAASYFQGTGHEATLERLEAQMREIERQTAGIRSRMVVLQQYRAMERQR